MNHESVSTLPELLVDEIECGLIVCDLPGRIVFANQAAQRELAAGRVLQRADRELRVAPGAGGGLDAALQQAVLRGRRQLVQLGHAADRLLVSVLPLRQGGGAVRALLVLGRRQACSELGLEMLGGFHGLTLAERRVMAGLLRRASPREIAAQHGRKLSTVRSQIHAIRSKLGARSIDELLLRAAEVPPVATALRMTMASPPLAAAA